MAQVLQADHKCHKRLAKGVACADQGAVSIEYGGLADTCQVGLKCGGERTCIEPKKDGESCASSYDCVAGTECVNAKCKETRWVPEGGGCGELVDGALPICVPGTSCVASKCTADTGEIGDACSFDGTKPGCGEDLSCQAEKCAAIPEPKVCR